MTDVFDNASERFVGGEHPVAAATHSLDQDPRFQIPLYLALGVFVGLVVVVERGLSVPVQVTESLTGTPSRVFFTASTVLAVLGAAIAAWFLRKQGVAALLPYVVGVVPIGSWLGYIAMRAWRGG